MKEDIMKETEAETVTQTPSRGLQQWKMQSDPQKVAQEGMNSSQGGKHRSTMNDGLVFSYTT